jgi:hypothetical protein
VGLVTQPAHPGAKPGTARALLVYNAARLLLLAACLGLGYVAGLRGFALIIAALLVSGLLSWFVLAPQRIRAAMAVEQAVATPAGDKVVGPIRRRRQAMRDRVAAEDAYAEALQRAQVEGPAPATDGAPRQSDAAR